MRYYPVNLDVQNRACLVVGGGAVGFRKVDTLCACGADVTVVSPRIDTRLTALADSRAIRVLQRPYRTGDLEGMFLVIGATDDEVLNLTVKQDADGAGILCNIADRPEACHFILPAIVQRGDLIIAISTSGKSPAFAKKLRKKLEKEFGPEYGDFLKLMGAARNRLLSREHEPEAHKPLFERLIDGNLIELIKQHRRQEINTLLVDVLGEGFDYDSLMTAAPQSKKSASETG